MKNKNWASILLVIAVVAALSIWLLMPTSRPDKVQSPQDTGPVSPKKIETAPPLQSRLDHIRRAQVADWNDFTNRFEKRFKPEIARWCKVYACRIPFDASDVTPDKFHSKEAGFIYTFMIGDTTFCIYDGPRGTYVFYMMTRAASQELNSPGNGAMPHDLSMPITRQEIVRLLKADSSIDYATDQVSINPIGKFSSMQGGVMVE